MAQGSPAEYPIEKVMAISAYQLLMSGVTSSIDVGGPAKESIELRDASTRERLSARDSW